MSSLLAVKLRRDLRANRSRLVLMVIAIAISLTVFGGVLYAWSASGRETDNGYRSTEPASATILLDQPLGAEKMLAIAADLRSRPGVVDATARTQFDTDVMVNGREVKTPLALFVATPTDPLRMAKFSITERGWPPSATEVFLGRDSLTMLGATLGDTLTIKTPRGETAQVRVADTVYDPSLSPAAQEQTARGYLSSATLAASGTPALLDQLKVQIAEPGQTTPSEDRAAIAAAATDLGKWLQNQYGAAIREIQVPQPYAHPHQWQADSLLLALLTGGALALLLSTILVANMLNNLFTQQIPQIGIMKAIGGRSGHIGRLYLSMTMAVAATATLLALGPAVLIGRTGVKAFLGFLGIVPSSYAAPWWTYAVIVAVGFGLPPLMALVPLVKASRTTVRAAIDHRGGGSRPSAATSLLARLGRLRFLDRGLLMALRNTVRRPSRFLLSVTLLASAGMVFVAGMSLGSSVGAVGEEQTARRNWDVDVQLAGAVGMDKVVGIVSGVPGISRVEGFTSAKTGVAGDGQVPITRTYPDQGHGRVSVTAISSGTTMFAVPKMLEGRWLNAGETGTIVINQVTRRNTLPDVHEGDTVQLSVGGKPTTWRVVGIAEERGGGSGVYTTAEGFATAMGLPQRVNQLRVATDNPDESTREAVAEAIGKALTDAGVEVQASASVSRMEAISGGHLGPIVLIVLIIAIAMGVVGAIGLASTMSTNVLDRTREFGVMHAIGAPPAAVRRVVVTEGVFLALTSCLVAVIPTLALTAVLGTGLGDLFFSASLPFRVSLLGAGIWFVLVILGAALATRAAAARASRVTVHEALAYL